MKTSKVLISVISLTGILLCLSACRQEPAIIPTQAPTQEPTQEASPMTITFSGDTCAYSGAQSIPFGKFTVNLLVEGQGDTTYAFTIITLKEGYSLSDLQAWPSTDRPDFVKVDFLNANSHTIKSGSKKEELDLTANAVFGDDPIYFVCFAAPYERKIGAVGPIEIIK